MNLCRVIVAYILVWCAVTDVYAVEQRGGEMSFSGIAYEIILTKLDHLQDKFVELESAMKQADLKLSRHISRLSGDMIKLSQRIDVKLSGDNHKLNERMDEKLSEVVNAINEQNRTIAQILLTQQDHLVSVKNQGESMEQNLSRVVNQMNNCSAMLAQSKIIELPATTQHEKTPQVTQNLIRKEDLDVSVFDQERYITIASCKKKPTYPSGKYMIQPTTQDTPFLGYCDQTVFEGGWLVFQYRYDGSVDFFRNWTEYRDGFGSVDGEFWLGLERLHRLTTARPHELLVELKDFDGYYYYARYDMFQIGNEEGQYTLQKLGEHTGTALDALVQHRDEKFSTVDRDNDDWLSGNCASDRIGAWWYYYCAHSNLNGPYRNSNNAKSMYWATNGRMSHAYSRMSIREK